MRLMLLMAVLATPAAATEVVRLSDAQREAVIAAAREYRLLAENKLEEGAMASPAAAGRASMATVMQTPGAGPAAPARKAQEKIGTLAEVCAAAERACESERTMMATVSLVIGCVV